MHLFGDMFYIVHDDLLLLLDQGQYINYSFTNVKLKMYCKSGLDYLYVELCFKSSSWRVLSLKILIKEKLLEGKLLARLGANSGK